MLAVIGMAINVVGDLTLGRAIGLPGLAASTTASFLVVAFGQVVALHAGLAAVAVAVVLRGLAGLWPMAERTLTSDLALLATAGVLAVAVYVAALAVQRGPELAEARELAVRLARRARPGT